MSQHFFSIRAKLAAGFAIAAVLIATTGIISIADIETSRGVSNGLTESWLPELKSLGLIAQSVGEYRYQAARLLSQDAAVRSDAAAATLRLDGVIRSSAVTFEATEDEDAEAQAFAAFNTEWAAYGALLQQARTASAAGAAAADAATTYSAAMPAYNAAFDQLQHLFALSQAEGVDAAAAADRIYATFQPLTLLVIALGLALVGGAVVWITRNVTQPIGRISQAMRRLLAGDESVVIDDGRSRRDEIGALIEAAHGYRNALLTAKDLARQADAQHRLLDTALAHMPVGLAMLDRAGRFIVSNAQYAEIYGLPENLTRPGQPLRPALEHAVRPGFYVGNDPEAFIAGVLEVVSGDKPLRDVVHFPDGRIININFQPMADGSWVSTHEDVTDRKRAESKITHMTYHDTLTDLPNRLQFRQRVADAVARPATRDGMAAVVRVDRITSSGSTTRSASRPATRCCRSRPRACATASGATTPSLASTATSSPCCRSARPSRPASTSWSSGSIARSRPPIR